MENHHAVINGKTNYFDRAMFNSYPSVIKRGKLGNPLDIGVSIGKSFVNSVFSIAMFDCRRVVVVLLPLLYHHDCRHKSMIIGAIMNPIHHSAITNDNMG